MNHIKLSMQLIYESFQKTYHKMQFHPGSDPMRLEGFRIYQPGMALSSSYVYLLPDSNLPGLTIDSTSIGFISIKPLDLFHFPIGCSFLVVEDCPDLFALIAVLQDTFEWYFKWEHTLSDALKAENPLEEMLEASLPVFHNPIFLHDADFYILACPHHHPRMSVWEREARTGRLMVPLQLINDFKVDMEYLSTLSNTRATLFSAEQRSYPILFMNLWNNDRYEGRICVNELESPILPGQYQLIEYLAAFILDAVNSKDLIWMSYRVNMEHFFSEFFNHHVEDNSNIQRALYYLGWKRTDRFLVLRLETAQHHTRHFSAAATINHIESQLTHCYSFFFQEGIVCIVNLSMGHKRASDIISSLAILLRDSLLKMGASSEIQDFELLPHAYYQAVKALELGIRTNDTNWYYHFDKYLLDFILQKSGEILPPEMLCSAKLLLLRRYDQQNNTEFYQTLKTYLELERNVLQTANTLYIHRSTLFYRLERIRKIADVNLDDSKERLVLRLSFYILDKT